MFGPNGGAMTRRYSPVPGIPPANPYEFSMFLRENLGVFYGPGTQRSKWFGALKDEMTINGWTWQDMICAVIYVKDRRINLKTPWGLFYHVNDAKAAEDIVESYDLISSVAEAISQEKDQRWLQRLSLAKGKALERVYKEWRMERAHI